MLNLDEIFKKNNTSKLPCGEKRCPILEPHYFVGVAERYLANEVPPYSACENEIDVLEELTNGTKPVNPIGFVNYVNPITPIAPTKPNHPIACMEDFLLQNGEGEESDEETRRRY